MENLWPEEELALPRPGPGGFLSELVEAAWKTHPNLSQQRLLNSPALFAGEVFLCQGAGQGIDDLLSAHLSAHLGHLARWKKALKGPEVLRVRPAVQPCRHDLLGLIQRQEFTPKSWIR